MESKNEKFESMSTNINLLLHTDEQSLRHAKIVKSLNFAAVTSLIGVGLVSLSVFILIQITNLGSIIKEQENVLKGISQLQTRQAKLFVFNNRVENIDRLLKTRKDLSNMTNILLAKIPIQLSVRSFELDDKSVAITAESRSLSAIGELVSNFTDMVRNKEVIKSLTLNSLILDEGTNAYQISIQSTL